MTVTAVAGSGAAAAYFSKNPLLGGILAVLAALAAATEVGLRTGETGRDRTPSLSFECRTVS